MKFASNEETHEPVISFLREVAGSWFEEGIQKIVFRMRKFVDKNDSYIEK